jgi:hypothetical protein
LGRPLRDGRHVPAAERAAAAVGEERVIRAASGYWRESWRTTVQFRTHS